MAAGQPLVSVVIPFFNAERTLLAAVGSVFAQTCTDWELILADDGSTDGSLALARSLNDPRVRVVSDGVNRGHADRRNQLTSLAQGEYIALLDADDLMHRQRLEKQLAFFSTQPGVDAVATGMASMTADFTVVGVRELDALDATPASVLVRGGIPHATLMARREWFQRHPYRPHFRHGEDRELFLRTLPTTRFAKLCEPLYFYMESGVKSPAKLLASYRAERVLIRTYGPRYVGIGRAFLLWLRSLVKTTAVHLLDLAGRSRRLGAGAPDSREDALLQPLRDEVACILATPLPRQPLTHAAHPQITPGPSCS